MAYAEKMVYFMDKKKVNGKENYYYSGMAFVDADDRILTGEYKGKFLSEISKIGFNNRIEKKGISGKPSVVYGDVSVNKTNIGREVYMALADKYGNDFYGKIDFSKVLNAIMAFIFDKYEKLVLVDTGSKNYPYKQEYRRTDMDKKSFEELLDFYKEGNDMPNIFYEIIKELENINNSHTTAKIGDNDNYRSASKVEPPIKKSKLEEKAEKKSLSGDTISRDELKEIIDGCMKKFIGQEAVIGELALNIFLNSQIIAKYDPEQAQRLKSVILLDGPTGTGKTAILQDLSKKMGIPFVKGDATSYTSYGYKGASLDDILKELLIEAGGDLELAQRGVVCLDEFDKLACPPNETDDKIGFKKSIQHELLKFGIDGEYNIDYNGHTVKFDTSKLTMIYMGAFTDLREKKPTIPKKKTIGFDREEEVITPNQTSNNSSVLDENDFIRAGFERELIGRIQLNATTKAYSRDDLKRILTESTISPLKEFEEFALEQGISVVRDPGFIDAYADYAFDINTGARALQKISKEIRNTFLGDILFSDKSEIRLSADTIHGLRKSNGRRNSK